MKKEQRFEKLKRVRNIQHHQNVALLIEEYDELECIVFFCNDSRESESDLGRKSERERVRN